MPFKLKTTLNSESSRQKKPTHLPGEVGVWVFILGDMVVFGLFFCTYLYYRALDVDVFNASQAVLDQHYGAINSVLLLSSSWFVALALKLVRKHQWLLAQRFYSAALVCGLGFGVVKIIEWVGTARAGYQLTTDMFFTFYYMLTGIHFLHVIIGVGVLFFLRSKAMAQGSKNNVALFESGNAYWHMVDLLWIVLFPLLYLVK